MPPGLRAWALDEVRAACRALPARRELRRRREAAAAIQRAHRRHIAARDAALAAADGAARFIFRAWRRWRDQRDFHRLRIVAAGLSAPLGPDRRADPRDLLRLLAPGDACARAALDPAVGGRVVVRLGGAWRPRLDGNIEGPADILWPPALLWRVVLSAPTVDVDAFAPRNYSGETAGQARGRAWADTEERHAAAEARVRWARGGAAGGKSVDPPPLLGALEAEVGPDGCVVGLGPAHAVLRGGREGQGGGTSGRGSSGRGAATRAAAAIGAPRVLVADVDDDGGVGLSEADASMWRGADGVCGRATDGAAVASPWGGGWRAVAWTEGDVAEELSAWAARRDDVTRGRVRRGAGLGAGAAAAALVSDPVPWIRRGERERKRLEKRRRWLQVADEQAVVGTGSAMGVPPDEDRTAAPGGNRSETVEAVGADTAASWWPALDDTDPAGAVGAVATAAEVWPNRIGDALDDAASLAAWAASLSFDRYLEQWSKTALSDAAGAPERDLRRATVAAAASMREGSVALVGSGSGLLAGAALEGPPGRDGVGAGPGTLGAPVGLSRAVAARRDGAAAYVGAIPAASSAWSGLGGDIALDADDDGRSCGAPPSSAGTAPRGGAPLRPTAPRPAGVSRERDFELTIELSRDVPGRRPLPPPLPMPHRHPPPSQHTQRAATPSSPASGERVVIDDAVSGLGGPPLPARAGGVGLARPPSAGPTVGWG